MARTAGQCLNLMLPISTGVKKAPPVWDGAVVIALNKLLLFFECGKYLLVLLNDLTPVFFADLLRCRSRVSSARRDCENGCKNFSFVHFGTSFHKKLRPNLSGLWALNLADQNLVRGV